MGDSIRVAATQHQRKRLLIAYLEVFERLRTHVLNQPNPPEPEWILRFSGLPSWVRTSDPQLRRLCDYRSMPKRRIESSIIALTSTGQG
jgi:hypothetical protein